MRLKEYLKVNAGIFGYGDLVIYERGYYELPDEWYGRVSCKEVYRELIFKATKCSTQLTFVNSGKLYDKEENKKIKKYLNRKIASVRMYTGDNEKYSIETNNFDKQIVEVVVYDENSELWGLK